MASKTSHYDEVEVKPVFFKSGYFPKKNGSTKPGWKIKLVAHEKQGEKVVNKKVLAIFGMGKDGKPSKESSMPFRSRSQAKHAWKNVDL